MTTKLRHFVSLNHEQICRDFGLLSYQLLIIYRMWSKNNNSVEKLNFSYQFSFILICIHYSTRYFEIYKDLTKKKKRKQSSLKTIQCCLEQN